MSRNRPQRPAHNGRSYTTQTGFTLPWRDRIKALLGGKINVKVMILVMPGASDIPTQVVQTVDRPRLRWPWKPAA